MRIDWKGKAAGLKAKGLNNRSISREIGISESQLSRYFNKDVESMDADSDFTHRRVARVPRRIIKSGEGMMAVLRRFAAGEISRQELMEGIKA